ncbi:MAG: hypothetical protein AAF587_07760 [Bacteroidota bacterium]
MTLSSPTVQSPQLTQAEVARNLIEKTQISMQEDAHIMRALLMLVARMRVIGEEMEAEFTLLQEGLSKYQHLTRELNALASKSE